MQYSTAHRGASRLPGVGRGDGTYFPVGPSSRLFYFGAAIIRARVTAIVAHRRPPAFAGNAQLRSKG